MDGTGWKVWKQLEMAGMAELAIILNQCSAKLNPSLGFQHAFEPSQALKIDMKNLSLEQAKTAWYSLQCVLNSFVWKEKKHLT